jgi:hypothetical protein
VVRIVTLQKEFVICEWLCPHGIFEQQARGWRVVSALVPPHLLKCVARYESNHTCTTGWVDPPTPVPAPIEENDTAKIPVPHRGAAPAALHPIQRDTRLKDLMRLRKAGVSYSEAFAQIAKESPK